MAEAERARRAYLGLYRLLRSANPEFYMPTCRLLDTHLGDCYQLPQEGMFFLQVSLEFLAMILLEERMPKAPFYAWVGISACRGHQRQPVRELCYTACPGHAAAALESVWWS